MPNPRRFLTILGFVGLAAFIAGPRPSGMADEGVKTAPALMPWQLSPEERHRIDVLTDQDHADMMAQLGIKQLRPGRDGSGKPGVSNAANYDEAKANPYPNYPDPLTLRDGRQCRGAGHLVA